MDECQAGLHICDVNAVCLNSIGNYSCQCEDPFSGDGFTCSRNYSVVNKATIMQGKI